MTEIKSISLYIPHVFPNFDKEYVANQFSYVGKISHIDFVAKQDRHGKNYNAVYIHFDKWYNNKSNRNLHYNITQNGFDHWYHDDNWYWIVLPNNAIKHMPGERKARIGLGDLKSISCSNIDVESNDTSSDISYLDDVKKTLEPQFEEVAHIQEDGEIVEFEAQIEAEMDEIEAEMEKEDAYLALFDSRYVEAIEQDNTAMATEIAQLRAALINLDQMYQAESAKVRAFNIVSV